MRIGIDEVGRGAWAGPLLVCALQADPADLPGVADSKTLTREDRLHIMPLILRNAARVELSWIRPADIDRHGLGRSLKTGVEAAFSSFSKLNIDTIIDGNINYLERFRRATAVVKADESDAVVSAASIIAKVARDNYMQRIDSLYPEYGFASHVGYGTKQHRSAIQSFGLTPLHRRSFKPLKEIHYFYRQPRIPS